ncbi:MAG: LuxR C-terminal-related transcriptional regulator [Gemmatimonadales bacterium]
MSAAAKVHAGTAASSASALPYGAESPASLLDTKLYAPKRRPGAVPRARLVARLAEGARGKLTLLSAPAGFGKTSLLAEWLGGEDGAPGRSAWVSLDATENDPTLFWSYVITALQRAGLDVGRESLSSLYAADPTPIEQALTGLINELDELEQDVVLVLDDYHVVGDARVHAQTAFLLDHLPARMHVVIASRVAPPLPVARLRARGELTEIEAGDLRFTQNEAGAFLRDSMALDVSERDVATLEQRTEGWAAGLQLAALSLKGRSDVRGLADAFSGDNRHVADYLVEEVLRAEPERVRRFLLSTSVLERLGGPLCEAVTGERDASSVLADLERRNVFVVPLDDRREWYRYHHLFAEVLRAHAMREDPARVRADHARASAWFESMGATADAIRHALLAGDADRAAALLEAKWPPRDRSHAAARWLEMVKALPDEVVRARPVLSMGYAWALLNSGELEASETRLEDVERWLADAPADASADASVDVARLRGELASARIYLSQSLGDFAGTVEHARRALEGVAEDDLGARATGTALLALAEWAAGDLESAHGTFTRALGLMRALGAHLDVIRGTFVLGDLRVAQGRLHEAARIYREGIESAAKQIAAHQISKAAAPETDELHLGLSELHREWNDLEAAERMLMSVTASAAGAEHKGNRRRWCIDMAAVRSAVGDLDGALELLEEAERVHRRDPIPQVRPIPAMKARLRLAQGRLADAIAWIRERGLSAEDDLVYMREYEHITLARVLLARNDADALPLLERLTKAAEAGGRNGAVIETLVLRALGQQTAKKLHAAFEHLERALELAEPEGYVRVFLDEGDRMRELLRQAAARGLAEGPVRRLLAAFDKPAPLTLPEPQPVDSPALLLTPRELVILRLIAGGLRNKEIAEELSITPATVKRHVANAYGKLGVSHRTEALKKAQELKLL